MIFRHSMTTYKLTTMITNTYNMFTPSPTPAVMSMMSASISKSCVETLCTARNTRTPVNTQITSTETRAPSTSEDNNQTNQTQS